MSIWSDPFAISFMLHDLQRELYEPLDLGLHFFARLTISGEESESVASSSYVGTKSMLPCFGGGDESRSSEMALYPIESADLSGLAGHDVFPFFDLVNEENLDENLFLRPIRLAFFLIVLPFPVSCSGFK